MRSSAYHILRVGIAITFLWIGVLILKDTQSFSALLQPWALELLTKIHGENVDAILHQSMIATAILDILVGIGLLINRFVIIASGLGAIHMFMVISTTAILVSVRDIGLLAGCLALLVDSFPHPFVKPRSPKEWLKLIISR